MSPTYRYPPTPLAQQPPEYQPYAQHAEDLANSTFGENGKIIKFRDSSGGLIGPFPFLIASKETGRLLIEANKAFGTLQSIPADAKEVAILVAGARFDAAYEQYAHKNIAIKTAGLSEDQVGAIREGRKPEGLSEGASVSYDACYYLANEKGPLPDRLYDAAVDMFGKEGALQMAHYVGIYCYLSLLMNFVNVPLPEGES